MFRLRGQITDEMNKEASMFGKSQPWLTFKQIYHNMCLLFLVMMLRAEIFLKQKMLEMLELLKSLAV